MKRTRPAQTRWMAPLALAMVLMGAGLWLVSRDSRAGARLVQVSYDSLHVLAGEQRAVLSESPVVIVYLDLDSHLREQHDPAQPWPRELHAALLDRLSAAGARAVVFDIVFSNPGPSEVADRELARAIRENGAVFLAGELDVASQRPGGGNGARTQVARAPYALFAEPARGWGLAELAADSDFVVRRLFMSRPGVDAVGLAWGVAEALRFPATQDAEAASHGREPWVRYYGLPYRIPHVSFSGALDPEGVTDAVFRDRIVFVGARPMVELYDERKDEFRSPYRPIGAEDQFMPGVEVHATQLLNLLRDDGLSRMSPVAERVWLVLISLVAAVGFTRWRPLAATGVALSGAALVLGLAMVGFSRGVWFPWVIVSAVQIPTALTGSFLLHSVEWYRERRRYEARIREQAALIEKANDAILVQSLEGRLLYANPGAERLYGCTADELLSAGAMERTFAPSAESARDAHDTAVRQGEWSGELQQQTKSGRVLTVSSRWTLICDANGAPRRLLMINTDVTEQKELEAQFLRTQRMNTIGTLAGGMAHDLNNALAPILMGAQLLRRRETNEEARGLLALMEQNTQRGAEMVRQVLLFARGRDGEFDQLDLCLLVKELEKMVRETFPKSIAVETFLPRDLWPVRGNGTQLHQVLLNLCVNARDAMPEGGKLSFIADNVQVGETEAATLPGARSGEFVSVCVSDTGDGMSAEVRSRMFESFFTTKGEGRGTGIGLATVKRIVDAHNGFLRVESELGQGTSFEVFLPRARVEDAATVATPASPPRRGQGELILVADDEKAIRELVQSELASFGYRVVVAANGAEAVTLLGQYRDDVRLAILDNAMPVLSGVEALVRMRGIRPDLPIIVASADGTNAPAGTAALDKPYALDELLEAIARLLEK